MSSAEENAARMQRLIAAGKLVLIGPEEILRIHLAWVHGQHAPEGLAGAERAHQRILSRQGAKSSCSYFEATGTEEEAS
jgi:hypothetical protein